MEKINEGILVDILKRISKLEDEREKQHEEEVMKLKNEIDTLKLELTISELQGRLKALAPPLIYSDNPFDINYRYKNMDWR